MNVRDQIISLKEPLRRNSLWIALSICLVFLVLLLAFPSPEVTMGFALGDYWSVLEWFFKPNEMFANWLIGLGVPSEWAALLSWPIFWLLLIIFILILKHAGEEKEAYPLRTGFVRGLRR